MEGSLVLEETTGGVAIWQGVNLREAGSGSGSGADTLIRRASFIFGTLFRPSAVAKVQLCVTSETVEQVMGLNPLPRSVTARPLVWIVGCSGNAGTRSTCDKREDGRPVSSQPLRRLFKPRLDAGMQT